MAPRLKQRERCTAEELAARDAAKAARTLTAALRKPLADRVKKQRTAVMRWQARVKEAHTYMCGGLDAWKFVHRIDPDKGLSEALALLDSLMTDLQIFDIQHKCVQKNYTPAPERPDVAAVTASAREALRAGVEALSHRYGLNP